MAKSEVAKGTFDKRVRLQAGFQPGFEKRASKLQHRVYSNEQFIKQHLKNKTIFLKSVHPKAAWMPNWLKPCLQGRHGFE